MEMTGNVLVLFCVGLAVVPGVQSLACTEMYAYNHLNDFLDHDKCESADMVFKYLHDMTQQTHSGECRIDIINKLANHYGTHAHTADHCQCSGSFKLQNYSMSSIHDKCMRDHAGYRDLYYQFFTSNHQPHDLVCRTHHLLWTHLRAIQNDDWHCQVDIVYHIYDAFSLHDPCTCSEKDVATTSSPHQQGQDQYDGCLQYYSYRELVRLVDHSTCMSVNKVWHLLDDLQVKNSSCRKHIQDRLTSSYNNVPTSENNECLCTSKNTLTDKHRIHILNNGSYTECSKQTESAYLAIERDLFTHITERGCRNHNYLWPTLAGVKDVCEGNQCQSKHIDCMQDLIVRAALDYPSQQSDSCVCTREESVTSSTTTTKTTHQTTTPTTTTHKSDVATTSHGSVVTHTAVISHCTDIQSYNYLNDFQHKDLCESVDLVFKYLHNITEQKGDESCSRDIINKLASHFGDHAHTPDHCQCTGKFTRQNYSRSGNDGIKEDLARACWNNSAYNDVFHQFFHSKNQSHDLVCRTHHSIWTQLRNIHDYRCQKDFVYHISYAFTQHSDPCSCSENHVTTIHSPVQHGQGHDHCDQFNSYKELASLANHSQCLSANTVWHLLDDLQKHDSGCRTHIQNLLLHSYNNLSTDGNDECVCNPKNTLTNKQHLHYTYTNYDNRHYNGCIHEAGSTYSAIERDLFTHITNHGCKNHNYLWPTLDGVKNHSSQWVYLDCTVDLITRATVDYPFQHSDSCVCVHKTITSSTLTTTTSTTQRTTTPTTPTTTTTTTTQSYVTTTSHGLIVVPQTTVSSHNENGWESWSPWTCKITKSDLSATCHNFRQRHCLSNTGCEGSSSETMDCNDSQCSDADITYVNCSVYNQYSTCEDQISCTYFSKTPWKICGDAAHVAQCPRLCTCCPIPTPSPTTTATQTTTPTTTTTTTTTSSTTVTQSHSTTSSSTITTSPTTTSTQTTTTPPKPEAVMTTLASTSTTMTETTPTASSTTTIITDQVTPITQPRTTETTKTQQSADPIISTTQQPSTTTSLPKCNHTCTLDAVILSMAVKNSKADNCSDKTSASNEALPMDCCNMGDHLSWTKGAQVQNRQVCTDGTPPPYTPIAAYNETGHLIPDSAGIFYGCIKDGQSGFMMIHQKCDILPHLLHVDGTQGKDPNNYFMFH